MNSNSLGKIIRPMRKQRKMTQKDLAFGICDVRTLIRIEKGEFLPSLYVIKLFSIKLGEDLMKYYEYLEYEDPIDVYTYFELFEHFASVRDYKGIEKQLEGLLNKYRIKPIHEKKILWYQWMVKAYVYHNYYETSVSIEEYFHNSYDVKYNALPELLTVKFLDPIDYHIINTLAVLQFHMNNYNSGIELLQISAKSILEKYKLENTKILLPIIYNLTKALYMQQLYDRCIDYCDMGIDISIRNNDYNQLGEIYLQKANALEATGNKEEAQKNYMYFITYYEMIGLSHMVKPHKDKLNQDYGNIFI